ncbi:Transcriptional regulator [Tenacibaculum sp. 190524A05c]
MSKKCKTSVKGCKKSIKSELFVIPMNKLLFGVLFCTLLLLSCEQKKSDFSEKVKVSLRNVGHQLLLSQKDSTSLVLPVQQLQEDQYKMSFQNNLQIEPSELVTIINSNFKKADLPAKYRVEVKNCASEEIAYSFEMILNEEKSIIPCSGRNLPNSCYVITVHFISEKGKGLTPIYIFVSLLFTLLIVIVVWYLNRKTEKLNSQDSGTQKLGAFLFYPDQNKLVKQAVEIPLSKKECEILSIFISRPNEIIKREELTKKVWEDNGVFVGRSLDTYISKIRKKIKEDTSIRLTNVHGVGYKLEVD